MSSYIYIGNCLEVLKTFPDESINCCVTSPPYWGLRDYGNSAQLGQESTPDAYVENMVKVFREVRRVLRADGTLWLNLGDSYAAQRGGTAMPAETLAGGVNGKGDEDAHRGRSELGGRQDESSPYIRTKVVFHRNARAFGLKHKDLVGIPWRVAFALQADGWWLRQDIIWHKPNPMPESVTDRCTKAHEYIFMLSKSAKYFYDSDAVKEPAVSTSLKKFTDNGKDKQRGHSRRHAGFNGRYAETLATEGVPLTRNRRSVWTVATKPYKGAHFATFPAALIRPCILAGCPPAGKRCDCDEIICSPTGEVESEDPSLNTGRAGMNRKRGSNEGTRPICRREQRGEAIQMRESPHRKEMEGVCGAAFAHYIRTDNSGARPLPEEIRQQFIASGWLTKVPPCSCPIEPAGTVLDPFGGSGTTGAVAEANGRNSVLIELNDKYLSLIQERIPNVVLT